MKKNYKQIHHNKSVVADILQHKQNKNFIDQVIEELGAWFSLPEYEKWYKWCVCKFKFWYFK